MNRILMTDPDGLRTLASEAGAELLVERGYELADTPESEPELTTETEPETVNYRELVEMAKSLGLQPHGMKKPDLIAAIEAKRAEKGGD